MTLLRKVALFFPLTNHTKRIKCFSSFLRDVHDEYVRTKNEDLILIFREGSFLLLLSFLLTPKKRPNEVWDRCLLRMRFFFLPYHLKENGESSMLLFQSPLHFFPYFPVFPFYCIFKQRASLLGYAELRNCLPQIFKDCGGLRRPE